LPFGNGYRAESGLLKRSSLASQREGASPFFEKVMTIVFAMDWRSLLLAIYG